MSMSYEQYAAWCREQVPGYRETEAELTQAEEAVYAIAETEPPVSSDACPVTIRSNRNGAVVTPRPKGSK
jgi:hypothetical protein